MAKHNELGKAGEDAAVKYLESKGYMIRHRNWRFMHWELDIVAYKDGVVRVIEDIDSIMESMVWKKRN